MVAFPVVAFFAGLDHQFDNLSVAYPVASLVTCPVEAFLVVASLEAYLVAASFVELDHQFDNLSVASLVAYPVEASLVACPVEASFAELDRLAAFH